MHQGILHWSLIILHASKIGKTLNMLLDSVHRPRGNAYHITLYRGNDPTDPCSRHLWIRPSYMIPYIHLMATRGLQPIWMYTAPLSTILGEMPPSGVTRYWQDVIGSVHGWGSWLSWAKALTTNRPRADNEMMSDMTPSLISYIPALHEQSLLHHVPS